MNIDDLHKLKRVETPPFLFTRIQQKIEESRVGMMPKKFVWAVGLSFVLVLALNIGMILSTNHQPNSLEQFAQSLDLVNDNTLYK
jgi:hypothetical protein